MLLDNGRLVLAVVLGASLCSGCAVPRYDVPSDSAGQPTVETIVYRIQCEIRDMVRDDMGNSDVTSFHRLFLLDGDYDVEIVLSLEVNDTGGLSPSLSYMNPLTSATSFVFSATGTLSESRDHNFTENIQLSVRNIFTEWKTNANPHNCPAPDTNLSGTLGLKDFVAMADLTPNLDNSQTLAGKGVFGGSIQFLVTKNLSAIGPTWSLVHFKGPGAASISEINTDKITLAFAQGPNAGKPMRSLTRVSPPNRPNPNAHWYIQQLLTSSINSQLITLQNSLQH
jgi:hypothetical protein